MVFVFVSIRCESPVITRSSPCVEAIALPEMHSTLLGEYSVYSFWYKCEIYLDDHFRISLDQCQS